MPKGEPSDKGLYDRCIVVVDGVQCDRREVVSHGVCGAHYNQKRTTGRYQKIRENYRPKGMNLEELAHWAVEISPVDENGCRIWPYARNGKGGYGIIQLGRKNAGGGRSVTGAHRLVAQFFHNGGTPLYRENVVHHLCANRGCVNPDHLVITTAAHNASEAQMRKENKWLRAEVARLRKIIKDGEGAE